MNFSTLCILKSLFLCCIDLTRKTACLLLSDLVVCMRACLQKADTYDIIPFPSFFKKKLFQEKKAWMTSKAKDFFELYLIK